MRRTIRFAVKQTQTQVVHTWRRSKRRKYLQEGIQREKQTFGWKNTIKSRNDIIKKTMDKDKALMTLGLFLIQKRRRQRNKQKVNKLELCEFGIFTNNGKKKVHTMPWHKRYTLDFISSKKLETFRNLTVCLIHSRFYHFCLQLHCFCRWLLLITDGSFYSNFVISLDTYALHNISSNIYWIQLVQPSHKKMQSSENQYHQLNIYA